MQISHTSASTPRGLSRFSRPEEISPHSIWLLWPAFLALWIAIASGSYALAKFAGMSSIAFFLLCALSINTVISAGIWCARGWKRSLCLILRPLLALALIGMMVAIRVTIPSTDEGIEPNTLVTLMLGFIGVLSVLFVGMRIGGRTVPLLAPLVPVFSLFGLLCLLAPSAVVQRTLILFVAATLYLLTYAHHIEQFCSEIVTGKSTKARPKPRFARESEGKGRNGLQAGAMMNKHWPLQSLLVSSLWFTLFLGGGLALYLPVGRYVPGLFGSQINRARAAAQNRMFDYRGGGSFMQLRGGHYALSDRVMLKITINKGEPSSLWRGRVYEYYDGSLWQENDPRHSPVPVQRRLSPDDRVRARLRARPAGGVMYFDATLSPLKNGRGQTRDVLEYVEPQSETLGALYASGQIRSWNEHADSAGVETVADDAGISPKDLQAPYLVSSVVIEPSLSALMQAPGYKDSNEKGLSHERLEATLQKPLQANTQRVLKAIADSIKDERRRPLKTPLNKVRAVSAYLAQNCRYSLNAPRVPVGEDAIAYFLVESHEGACDMFASSMVLLLREMDVPARLASGYLVDESSASRAADGRSVYTVRERDAHAWVEYFVPGFGWMTYDPTQDAQSAASPLSQNLAFLMRVPELHFTPILGGLVCLMVGLVSFQGVERYRKRPKLGAIFGDDKGRIHILQVYERAKRVVSKKVRFEGHLTPEEFEARVSRSRLSSAAKLEFSALTHLAIAARYGEVPIAAPHEVDACFKRLKRSL